MNNLPAISSDIIAHLVDGREHYAAAVSPFYDEVLQDIAQAVQEDMSLGKADIGALLFWKRLRADTTWVRHLMELPDDEVRDVTRRAVTAARDPLVPTPEAAGRARAALTRLPGFARGDALASAVLLASAPDRMAVYDRRAQAGLESLGITQSSARGRYRRYMALLEQLRVAVDDPRGRIWTNRDVDLALYSLGGR